MSCQGGPDNATPELGAGPSKIESKPKPGDGLELRPRARSWTKDQEEPKNQYWKNYTLNLQVDGLEVEKLMIFYPNM